MLERLRVWFWIARNYPLYKFRCWQSRAQKQRLRIMSSQETVDYILEHRCSVARFGDGELQMVSHYLNQGNVDNFEVDTFQDYNPRLGERLFNILKDEILNFTNGRGILCLPYQLCNSSISMLYGELFWDREWLERKDFLSAYCLDRLHGDTNFTRFYMGRKDIADYPAYIASLQKIWAGRHLLIVEGELSRLGVGNDLFATAQNIQRIICPKTNAFDRYDDILTEVKARATTDSLIILALGHTATVLAYDLQAEGLQALDLGHIDVEYEWYRMQAKSKVPIPNKYVNEVASGRIESTSSINEQYHSEIVAQIL